MTNTTEKQIEELEGEVMLAGFYGTTIEHIKPRLLKLYQQQRDEDARRAAG